MERDESGRAVRVWVSAQGGQGSGSQEKPAATMTGTWAFEVTHSAGTSTPTVTITQTDGKLSGKYQSTYGQFDLTGSIKGNEFTFRVEIGTEQRLTQHAAQIDGVREVTDTTDQISPEGRIGGFAETRDLLTGHATCQIDGA